MKMETGTITVLQKMKKLFYLIILLAKLKGKANVRTFSYGQ